MPRATLALKATVTRRQAAPVPSALAERLTQLQHSQEPAPDDAPPEKSGKQAKREAHPLQSAFLAGNLGKPVVVYLINGGRLTGRLKQFDQYCLLLDGSIPTLVFKHAASTIAPQDRNHDR